MRTSSCNAVPFSIFGKIWHNSSRIICWLHIKVCRERSLSERLRIRRKVRSSPSALISFGTLVGGPTVAPSSLWNWIVNVGEKDMDQKCTGESSTL